MSHGSDSAEEIGGRHEVTKRRTRARKDPEKSAPRRGADRNSRSTSATVRTGSIHRTLWALVVVLCVVAVVVTGIVVVPRLVPPPPIVVPSGERKLDPVVRDLVDEQVAIARARPRAAESHATLGLVYEANGLWQEAAQSFGNAVSMEPEHSVWTYHWALALRQIGAFERALRLMERLAGERPGFAALQYRYGDALLENGSLDEAEAAFRRARAAQARAPEPLVGVANVMLRRNDYQAAAALLERVVEEEPGYKAACYALGLAYRGLGRAEDARRFMRRGLDASPRYILDPLAQEVARFKVGLSVQVGRAADLIESGKAGEAAAMLESALRRRPDDTNVMINLAAAYRQLGQAERGREVLSNAARLDRENFAISINLALCHADLGDLNEALRYADLAAIQGPTIGQVHYHRGTILARLGRMDEALDAFGASLKLDARNPMVHLFMGDACASLRRDEEAREHYYDAVRQLPNSIPARLNLCAMCIRMRLFDEASQVLEAARAIAPNHPRVLQMEERLGEARE